MVKLSLKKLKLLKFIILILSLVFVFSLETIQTLDFQANANQIWVEKQAGQLQINGKVQSGFLNLSQAKTIIRASQDSVLRVHDHVLQMQKDTELQNLILNQNTYHGKLLTGSMLVQSNNLPSNLSIQVENYLYTPLGASVFTVQPNGIKVHQGVVITHKVNANGNLLSSVALTKSQRIGSIQNAQFKIFRLQNLDTLLNFKVRSRIVEDAKGANILNLNSHQTVQDQLNTVRLALSQLQSTKQFNDASITEVLTSMAGNQNFKVQWQKMSQDILQAIFINSKQADFASFLEFLLQKHFKELSPISQKYLLVYELDRINTLRLRNIRRGFNESQISLLQAIDNFKLQNDYQFNHYLILTVNAMLKNQSFWTVNLFEIRRNLFEANLKLKKDKTLYSQDFAKQNQVFLDSLMKNSSRVKNARAIADVLISNMSQDLRLKYIQKVIEL